MHTMHRAERRVLGREKSVHCTPCGLCFNSCTAVQPYVRNVSHLFFRFLFLFTVLPVFLLPPTLPSPSLFFLSPFSPFLPPIPPLPPLPPPSSPPPFLLSAFVDWSRDDPGLLILRDAVEDGLTEAEAQPLITPEVKKGREEHCELN